MNLEALFGHAPPCSDHCGLRPSTGDPVRQWHFLLLRLLFDPAKARPLNFAKVRHAKFPGSEHRAVPVRARRLGASEDICYIIRTGPQL
jgi:hypothetical protein